MPIVLRLLSSGMWCLASGRQVRAYLKNLRPPSSGCTNILRTKAAPSCKLLVDNLQNYMVSYTRRP
jgi:hypothetical protein